MNLALTNEKPTPSPNLTLMPKETNMIIEASERIIFTSSGKNSNKESIKDLNIDSIKESNKKIIIGSKKDSILQFYSRPKTKLNQPISNTKFIQSIDTCQEILPIPKFLQENLFKCFLCETFHSYSSITTKLKCSHPFCNKCGKAYYEGLIEEGTREGFLCPMYSCKTYIHTKEILPKLISSMHLLLVPIEFDVEEKKKAKQLMLKTYGNKNVIDISNNKQFYQYSFNKHLVCPKCNELSLYGKTTLHFAKCRNCFYKLCKHCSLEYTVMHMDMRDKDRCKVFYRKTQSLQQQQLTKKM